MLFVLSCFAIQALSIEAAEYRAVIIGNNAYNDGKTYVAGGKSKNAQTPAAPPKDFKTAV